MMGLLEALIQEAAPFNLWVAARTDRVAGNGTAQDPFNGATRKGTSFEISLSYLNEAPQEARVNTAPKAHGLEDGDVVSISGVTGDYEALWNGTFGIYGVSQFEFRYFMKKAVPPDQPIPGEPKCARLSFPFDEIMRNIPPSTRIQLGPGVFQTRGFAPNDARGFQAKSGWKIVGAGVDVTVLQLLGADMADEHYHVIGMPIEPNGTTAIAPLEHFEVSDLTIDANLGNQAGES